MLSEFVAKTIDNSFTTNWAEKSATGSPADRIDVRIVIADRRSFEKATFELDRVASQMLAQSPRVATSKTSVDNVNGIFDLFEELLKKYLGLLTGSALVNAEPTAQYDTWNRSRFLGTQKRTSGGYA